MLRVFCLLILFFWATVGFAQGDSAPKYEVPPMGATIIDLIYRGHFQQAEQAIENMVREHGDGLGYEILRIKLAYAQGTKAEAIAKMQALLQQKPNNVNVLLAYGLLLWQEKKLVEADSIYTQAQPLCGNSDQCLFMLRRAKGYLFASQYRYQEAIDLHLQNLSIYPNEYYTNFQLAYCYISLGNLEQALKHAKIARKLGYNEFDLENNIGLIYNMQGEYKKAVKIFEKLKPQQADHYYVLCNLGYAYAQTGKVEQGLEMMHKAQQTCPDHCYIYRNLAVVYLALGEKDKACNYFAKALEQGFTQQFGNEVLQLQQQHCQ